MVEDAWENFAKSGAEHYIATSIDSSTPEGRQAFFRSGQEYVDGIVADLAGVLLPREAALDFGCGVGRLAIPLAGHFRRVVGVDISPTMLEKLDANCAEMGVSNLSARLSDDPWEDAGPFDLVNSCWVFQHLPSDELVETYLRRMAAGLADTGVCVLQFDSRAPTAGYRLRNAVPDPLLPDRWRSGIRRIRRPPARVHALFRRAGLQVIDEHGLGTPMHLLRARRA